MQRTDGISLPSQHLSPAALPGAPPAQHSAAQDPQKVAFFPFLSKQKPTDEMFAQEVQVQGSILSSAGNKL